MMKGKFITIEGIEGAGKSTTQQFIREYLAKKNIDVVWTREPGGTDVAEHLRQLILHSTFTETIFPEAELLMMFAARMQHLKHKILPALAAGKWVVSDRYVDASYAYQGGGRKIEEQYVQMLDQWIVGSTYPDLTLLLDIPPDLGFSRTEMRGTEKDRIEQEKMDFFVRVRDAYLQRARQNPSRIKIIDASLTLPEVQQQIRDVLDVFVR